MNLKIKAKKTIIPEPILQFLKSQDFYILSDYTVRVEHPERITSKLVYNFGFPSVTMESDKSIYTITMKDSFEVIVIESNKNFSRIKLIANYFLDNLERDLI